MDKKITTEVSKLQASISKISPIIYEICAEIGHISKLLGKKEYIDRYINKKQMIQNQINQKKHEMENLKQQEKNNDDILDYSPYQSGYKSLKPRSKTHGNELILMHDKVFYNWGLFLTRSIIICLLFTSKRSIIII